MPFDCRLLPAPFLLTEGRAHFRRALSRAPHRSHALPRVCFRAPRQQRQRVPPIHKYSAVCVAFYRPRRSGPRCVGVQTRVSFSLPENFSFTHTWHDSKCTRRHQDSCQNLAHTPATLFVRFWRARWRTMSRFDGRLRCRRGRVRHFWLSFAIPRIDSSY